MAGLGGLVLAEVPAEACPLVPDDELDPPAGPKTVDDVAGYADDADREAGVLTDYGYRWGWERFWRDEDALASVFVDQFEGTPGRDLLRRGPDPQRHRALRRHTPTTPPTSCPTGARHSGGGRPGRGERPDRPGRVRVVRPRAVHRVGRRRRRDLRTAPGRGRGPGRRAAGPAAPPLTVRPAPGPGQGDTVR